jgi:hypothetical protein
LKIDPGVKALRDGYPHGSGRGNPKIGATVIVLGIILLVIGYFTGLSILYTIGGLLLVIGIILWILGAVGRPVAGRKVWF